MKEVNLAASAYTELWLFKKEALSLLLWWNTMSYTDK
jgi:hypothetical protein